MTEFTKKEIVDILKDDRQNEWLFSLADKVRRKNVGDEVHLRGLIEFSNICHCFCKYCGLRCENKELDRYRILPDDIVKYAQKAVEMGYKTIVLQSGEDAFYTREILCDIIKRINFINNKSYSIFSNFIRST